jgi:protein-tyrosine phosphatase
MYSFYCATKLVIYDKVYDYFYGINETNTGDRLFEDSSYYNQYSTFLCKPQNIVDNIYIGSAHNAANFNLLEEHNIKLIINMTNEITNYYPEIYIYKQFGLNDNNKDDIKKYLDTTYETIEEFNKNNTENKNILIHCFMGKSRSASIIIYYIMKKYNKTFEEALIEIKSKRGIVNPNLKFRDTLKYSKDKNSGESNEFCDEEKLNVVQSNDTFKENITETFV